MTERLRTRTRTRTRKIGTTETAAQIKAKLDLSMKNIASRMKEIEAIKEQINDMEVEATAFMKSLDIDKEVVGKITATYDHPAQRNVRSINVEGLFEDVSVDDFLNSITVQVSSAEKVIDPKVLKKHTTTLKTPLKPKVFKIKVK